MKSINIFTVEDIKRLSNHVEIGGKWVDARPEGYHSFIYRLKVTWLVFTGKADALKWDRQ
jgi:hypothetical protein